MYSWCSVAFEEISGEAFFHMKNQVPVPPGLILLLDPLRAADILAYGVKSQQRACVLSCVQLFGTPGLGPARLLCPWDFPARILEWVTISSSRRSRLRD